MAAVKARTWSRGVWALAARQHGVVRRSQLAELGMTSAAIRHRLDSGRLHRVMPGVYAVGRPELTERGRWMAAVLACRPNALLSHRSAAALLGIRKPYRGAVEVVVPPGVTRRRPGIEVYSRARPAIRAESLAAPGRELIVAGIPATGPAVLLIDLATCLGRGDLEAAINEADHRGLVDPEALRAEVDALSAPRGATAPFPAR